MKVKDYYSAKDGERVRVEIVKGELFPNDWVVYVSNGRREVVDRFQVMSDSMQHSPPPQQYFDFVRRYPDLKQAS